MRLIDADELIKKFKRLRYNDNSYIRTKLITETLHNLVPEVIAEQRTIEAEPVKHAKWYAPASGEPCEWCSNCHERTRWFFDEGYCPKCGARMDGGDENA